MRSNVIAPGLIDTPLGRAASGGRPSRDKAPVPLGRQGTAWEVAAPVCFLLSDDAAYILAYAIIMLNTDAHNPLAGAHLRCWAALRCWAGHSKLN